ncbi:hypothetical protein LIER_25737 [Lithospermum erythrorhizon]|uniref:Uncharacterized protein n=1 Tax=Lithospermum erythrorhizon TaxID=34254 RepID=A0AAV3R7C2_LITER
MSSMKQRRMPSNIAADRGSCESLSFTALVCVQEQKSSTKRSPLLRHFPPSPKGNASVPRKESEFEFSITTHSSPNTPINITSSPGFGNPNKGQVQTEAIRSQKREVDVIPKRRTNGPSRAILEKNGSLLTHEAARSNKKTPKKGFSFAAPCRLCSAEEPELIVKEQILHGRKTQ